MTIARTRVKICGLTNLEDALWARACGADMLGFVMVPTSPRYVTPLQVACITRALRKPGPGPRGDIRLVGVFADRHPYAVRIIAELCGLDVIQLHGHEPAEQAALQDRPVILARRVDVVAGLSPQPGRGVYVHGNGDPFVALRAGSSLAAQDDGVSAARDDAGSTQPWAILLDTCDPRRLGGSGQVWDWSLLADAPRPKRLIVAGGLTPDNVALAVRDMHPWGVDVCSGVEASPGRKDPALVERFVRKVREEDERNDGPSD